MKGWLVKKKRIRIKNSKTINSQTETTEKRQEHNESPGIWLGSSVGSVREISAKVPGFESWSDQFMFSFLFLSPL